MNENIKLRDYFNPSTLAQLSQIANNYNTSWQPSVRFNPQLNNLADLSTLATQIINARRQGYIPSWDRGLYSINYSEY